jgi:hypothetical protein
MRPSSITVHIEELALHGFSPRDAAQLEADLQRELVQVIVERGVSPGLVSRRVARVDGGVLRLQPNTGANRLARELAAIVHRSLGAASTPNMSPATAHTTLNGSDGAGGSTSGAR